MRLPWILASGVLLAGVAFSCSWAQTQPHATVVKAVRRAFSPPLSQMVPLPPASGGLGSDPDDVMPLGRHAARTTPSAGVQRSADANPVLALPALSTDSGLNILGVGTGFSDYTEQAIVPDTNVAVGATQFVQFVNDTFAVFDKSTGNLIYSPASGNTLWQNLGAPCSSSKNLDEIAQYDKLANVWVMLMPLFTNPSYLCIAVSTTSDATGSWNLYAFEIPTNSSLCQCHPMPDYPKLAVWPDAYYVAYDEAVDVTYEGAGACAVDRNSMLSGAAATMQCFTNDGTSNGLWLAADLDGATPPPSGEPDYFLNLDPDDESLDLWQFHVDWTTPGNSTFTGPTNIPVTAFKEPCGDTAVLFNPEDNCVPQAGTTREVNAYGDRLMYRLAYRNFGSYESLVANHTVQVTTGSDQTGIRWYELENPGSGFEVSQQGTYAPDSDYRFMGSIAMDRLGDIAVGYSVSGSGISPSIRYAGRVPSDPAGEMESEIDALTQAGIAHGSWTSSTRWADYSGMSLDPVDDCTFFYTTEYVPTTGSTWSTRIVSFSFPSCVPGFTVTPTPSAATVSAGGMAVFSLAIAAQGGFSGAVTLSCSAPTTQGVNCSLASTSAQPGTNVNLTVTTTGPSAALTLSPGVVPLHPFYAAWIGLSPLALMGFGSVRLRSIRRRLAFLLLCVVLSGLIAIQVACGSGGGSNTSSNGGTPAGTYTVNITAVSGTTRNSSSVSLTVQ
jgi:hypothetical protein